MANDRILRIGLYGSPGAGKSTTSRFIEEYCSASSILFHRIRLADPIYEAQACVYSAADRHLTHFYEQDGELLNFLGYYLRKLNETILLDRFAKRLTEAVAAEGGASQTKVIVCDDMRFPDAAFLRKLGFISVRITATEAACVQRRINRSDRSLSSPEHITERNLGAIACDLIIENDGTLDALRHHATSALGRLLHDLDG
jgi:dephospho-CoA kinase